MIVAKQLSQRPTAVEGRFYAATMPLAQARNSAGSAVGSTPLLGGASVTVKMETVSV